jgi:protocatechuate 3,4-dioxygenase beta subunit
MSAKRTLPVAEDDLHDHDRGLAFDISTLMSRRRALQFLAVGGLTALVGCGSSGDSSRAATTATPATTSAASTSAATDAASTVVSEISEETGGPFPADGSNGPNVLSESGIVRRDVRSSFGSFSGRAEGIPLTVSMTILDVQAGGTPVAGAAVYIWHCSREGGYSLYSDGVTDQNYLRGVQEADGDGKLSFLSVYPGAYQGRWPHVHFEVYPSLAEATAAGSKLVTSQIALPEDTSAEVYATTGYEQSVENFAQTSLATDNVFSDGYSTQLGTVTGSIGSGLTVQLNVGV